MIHPIRLHKDTLANLRRLHAAQRRRAWWGLQWLAIPALCRQQRSHEQQTRSRIVEMLAERERHLANPTQ